MPHFVQAISIFLVLFALVVNPCAYACTALMLPQSPNQVLAANMDWAMPQGLILINKRDVQKTSAFIPAPQVPLTWTSTYMSLTFTETGREFPWEGINEKGLAVNLLELLKTELPLPDSLAAINGLQWIQYILDTSATLSEAITNAQKVRVGGNFSNADHYFVCDATGSCATFEYIFENLVIHQGAALPYSALANSGYQTSLDNLQSLLQTETPAEILASTRVDSLTRFAKAAMFSSQYSPTQDPVAYAFTALSSVRQNDTQWSLVFSLATQTVQYKTVLATAVKAISLSQFEPHCSTPVMFFHVNSQLSGDVTSSFATYTPASNDKLLTSNSWSTPLLTVLEGYPDTTRCTEPSTTVISSENPALIGDTVTLKAVVVGNGGVPTGSVTFQNNGSSLGTASLDGTGTALLKVSSLPLGTNLITASYSGDRANPSNTSFALSQIVAEPTQTVVNASANPSPVGQPVTFTATVSSPNGVTPTGFVAFSLGGKVASYAPLVNGQATYTRTLTISGTRQVTAAYSGDGTNPPSTSAILNEVVY